MVAGQIADSSSRLIVDSRSDETFEVRSGGVENAERPEARGDEPHSHLDGLLKDILERRLRADRGRRRRKLSKALFLAHGCGHSRLKPTFSQRRAFPSS
jgi:hypothetical protein